MSQSIEAKLLEQWLFYTQAIALFALAAFVNFSIAGAHISLGLLTLAVGLQLLLTKRRQPAARAALMLGFEWPVMAFTGACLIATLLSDSPRESFHNMRHLLTILGAYGVACTLRQHHAWRTPLLWTYIAVASAAALYGLAKFALGDHIKVMSTQSTTMTWGAMATMFALITTQAALSGETRRARWLARLLLAPQLLALLFSLVRGAYVGYFAGLAYVLMPQWRRALPAALFAIILLVFIAPDSLQQRVLSIFDLSIMTTQVRFEQWRYAVQIFTDHPFFGVGWRDLAALTRSYAPPGTNMSEGVAFDVFHIGHYHSIYVTLLVCVGLVGLSAFLWLMFAVWRKLGMAMRETSAPPRQVVKAARAAMVGFLVAGLFDWTFGDAEVVTMFWFVIGMGLGQHLQHKVPTSAASFPAA